MTTLEEQVRCIAVSPKNGRQCTLPAAHLGTHTTAEALPSLGLCALKHDDQSCRRRAIMLCSNGHALCRGHYAPDYDKEPATFRCMDCGVTNALPDEGKAFF